MTNWIPLNWHSQFSLCLGLHKPKEIVQACKGLGYKSVGLADHGSLAGTVEFYVACKEAGIKPILGCHFTNYYLIAANFVGWKNLLKHQINPDHPDTTGLIYIGTNPEHIRANQLKYEVAGTGIELFDNPNTNELREIANDCDIPTIALCSPYYLSPDNAIDQQLLVCLKAKKTLAEVKRGRIDPLLAKFFSSKDFCLKSHQEMKELLTGDDIDGTLWIDDHVDNFDILSPPRIPHFSCPDGLTPDQYLRQLARDGWAAKIKGKISDDRINEYLERIKMELSVIEETGLLANYFLVVRDYINAARSRGELVGPGRGSSAGCLVSYLVGITGIDPIPHKLSFTRFYNSGRNTKDRVLLPDIDIDFEQLNRHKTHEYLRKTYGEDKVAQMATYGRSMGKGILKDVLRIHNACSFDEMNRITEYIPDESKISDELENMRDEGDIPSIIMWALEENASKLSEWCELNEDGTLEGPYSYYFAQAIRLEGVKKSQGKHASGVVIANEPLLDFCPMTKDKSSDGLLVSPPMNEVELIGGPKFDILSTGILDKMSGWQKLVRGERISEL